MIFKIKKINIFLLILFLILSGCNSDGEGFNDLEDSEVSDTSSSHILDEELEIIIESIIPDEDLITLIEFEKVTFGVEVNSGAGDVSYQFYVDNLLVQESNSPFYIMDTFYIEAGSHDVQVIAKNSVSEVEYYFNTKKNSKPLVNLDSNTSQVINCISDTFTVAITAVDPDADDISFSYYLNGNENNAYLSGSNTASTSQAVFNPICSLAGSNTVTIRATDSNGEFNEVSVAVSVTNPNIASIDSYSPTDDPVIVLSTNSKSFLVSASGNAPLIYSWSIEPGSVLTSCSGSSTCTLSGGDLTPGNYVLKAGVLDSLGTEDEHSFSLTINDKPTISSYTPSNSTAVKMNCNSIKSFQIQIEDLNIGDGQAVTTNWYLDNSSNSSLTTSYDTSSYPYIANATFSPNCSSSLLGEHTIKVVVSDGHENQEFSWSLETNYFSDSCNNLDPGEICTLVGMVGMGSHLDVDADKDLLRFAPGWVASHPDGIFFTDFIRSGVWFYNPNADERTVLGKSIPANNVVAMFGQNYYGKGTAGKSYTDFYLYNPRGLAYSLSEDSLYVADDDNDRVVKFNSLGVASIFAGGGSSDIDGASRTAHRCIDPTGISLDENNEKLFVACNSNSVGTIKEFSTSNDNGTTLIRYTSNAVTEGSTGYNGSARLGKSYALVKDPHSDILYAADNQRCRIVAISYGGSAAYYGGEVVLNVGEMKRLTFNDSCNSTVGVEYSSSSGRIRVKDLEVYSDGTTTKGLFFSNADSSYIGLLNLTETDITLGGNTIAGKYYDRVWGSGSRDYGRGEPAYTASYGNYPYGLALYSGKLVIGDYRNGRVGGLDISTGNGESFDFFGNHYYSTYDDETDKHANKRQLNQPFNINYSIAENKLFFSDFSNYRIRSVSLDTGAVVTEVGRGSSGNSNSNPEYPLDVYLRSVYDFTLSNNGELLLYADYNGGTGTNRNCLIRAYNMGVSDETLFTVPLESGLIRSIAGSFGLGCQVWDNSSEGESATSIALRSPLGVFASQDSSELYTSDYYSHCIQKVDSNGVITTAIGSCGISGNSSGDLSSSLLSYPGTLVGDSEMSDYDNFFIVERGLSNNSRIKYVNKSSSDVDILGQTIGANQIGEVISNVDYVGAVATYENQVCYTQGTNSQLHNYAQNVTCLNRDDALTSLRVGRVSSSSFNGAVQIQYEEEGVQASSASLSGAYGLSFDNEGNLYITERRSNTIRMVKRWF